MSRRIEHPLTRVTALGAALCVLLLAVFAASPELHAGLHEATATADCGHAAGDGAPVGDAGHACAVTLFAQGALTLLVFCLLVLARPVAVGRVLRTTDVLAVVPPRYRHVPSHAPPAA